MKLRLNMWQRMGVVASVLWAVGGGLYQRSHDLNAAARIAFAPCDMDKFTDLNAFKHCGEADYANLIKDEWVNASAVALGPVLAGWILAYVVIWVSRWVWAGRKAP